MSKNNELKYWIAISKIPRIGAVRFTRLLNFFPDLETCFNEATVSDLKEAGLENNVAEEFIIRKKEINPDTEISKLQKENISVVTRDEPEYPKLLKEIYAPPPVLYYRGDLASLQKNTLAVVGTRRMTNYGRLAIERLLPEIVTNNFTIVSGLALGIDAEAHLETLKNSGTTIAVLGSSLEKHNIYPATNRYLSEQIIQKGGLLLSEYPLGTIAMKHNFPARNRLISGLSLGTLVIEAGEISGAIITAMYALEQNREVLAVPGNIHQASSAGTNKLIKDGARVITSAADVLEALNIHAIKKQQTLTSDPLSPEEATIVKLLQNGPKTFDQLVRESGTNAATMNATIAMLELQGKLKNIGSQQYILA